MKLYLTCLKAQICGLQLQSRRLRRLSTKLFGLHKQANNEFRNKLGSVTRYRLLAYGFLRGTPYKLIETPPKYNLPMASEILSVIKFYVPTYEKLGKVTARDIADWIFADSIQKVDEVA